MSQQAPKLVSDTHYCVVGDVSVDDSAAIAPGVVLQAASGSRIVICEGACLAAGVCIQSRKGVLTIAAGASLGANVLVVGKGEVGADACVSAGTTLMNPSVHADSIIPPDSLIASESVQKAESDFQDSKFQSNGFQNNGFQSSGFQNKGFQNNGFQSNGFHSNTTQSNSFQNQSSYQENQSHSYSSFQTQHNTSSVDVQSSYQANSQQASSQQASSQQSSFQSKSYSDTSANSNNGANNSSSQMTVHTSSYDRVYGREQVTKLISALFPNRKSLSD